MWNKGWDVIFKNNKWGTYPGEELIRFISRKYIKGENRSKIKILELGCGAGANLWFLSREGFDCYGVDGSKHAIRQANELLKKENLKAKIELGDVSNLEFDNNYFDCVIDIECIYSNNLSDTEKILDETFRVLKPFGLFFSKTFSVGMSGENTGIKYKNEPNTYSSIAESPLRKDYGIIRLTAEHEINSIYSKFSNIEYDYIERSDKNRKNIIKEWIITAQKL